VYCNHFTLKIDHKPLEWLVTVSNAYGRGGRWINTLQDFSFKIVHRVGAKQMNIDALSCNPVDVVDEQEDLIQEFQDCKLVGLSSTLIETIWTR
jgi:hypothetical protein